MQHKNFLHNSKSNEAVFPCATSLHFYENTQNTFPYNTIVLIRNIGLYKFDDYFEYIKLIIN